MAADVIEVEVAYATPAQQLVIPLSLEPGSTAEQAILASGLLQHVPDIDLDNQPIGIFGQPCKRQHIVQTGDRIEIYRPLPKDPMKARRLRV
ncbi:MAG: RnfH family protein [Methylomonas sp.]|nr:RnfH family protein [Methylomonas sp.]PPD21232.1 MAG: RnfH family protein [Methylomonas sp.]PPD27660.1 MAG: RnfH family protein [Methylomonas sp.]PPD38216.1 MAG: RnfH family protein [Methylomonas sp.]PPD39646.1 MAG: RnfH family protein [Methylomonas sp.]